MRLHFAAGFALFTLGGTMVCGAPLPPRPAPAADAETHYPPCLSPKKAGKLEDAERECRTALNDRPEHASALYTLGTLQRQKNQLEDALKSFHKVRELEPQSALGWAGEGSVLLRLNRADEAVVALKQ